VVLFLNTSPRYFHHFHFPSPFPYALPLPLMPLTPPKDLAYLKKSFLLVYDSYTYF
jgi:hypothetical protein